MTMTFTDLAPEEPRPSPGGPRGTSRGASPGARPPSPPPAPDWSAWAVVAAMALLSIVGYWADDRFEGLSQGQEWSVDTADVA